MLESTKLNRIGSLNQNVSRKVPMSYQPGISFGQVSPDTVSFIKQHDNVIAFGRRGKESCVVTFTGLTNPPLTPPALQMKVVGVTAHQAQIEGSDIISKDDNINRLADSQWKDGQPVTFQINNTNQGIKIFLSVPGFGKIGRVPDDIAPTLAKLMQKSPQSFHFELSNVIAGTTKGAETIGLRVNLIYDDKNPDKKANVNKVFNSLLDDPKCSKALLLYQPKTSPEEVLKLMLDYEAKTKSPEAAKKMEEVVNNIVSTIKDPNNKRILLVGHCKPDGDTLGCVLGMKNAISLMDPSKQVDCSVDDKIPGLFRHKMPGIDGEIKQPHNLERLQKIKDTLTTLEARPKSKHTDTQIELLKRELDFMQNPDNLLDQNAKYDLVITMDLPTPERFTNKFKKYFDEAKKVIYIDHHPQRLDEWQNGLSKTGLDMDKVHDNKLAWVADTVPAATQLVAVIGNKLLPVLQDIGNRTKKARDVFTEPGQMDKLNAYIAALVTGMSTDTGAFTRTANLLPEHVIDPETNMPVPVQKRPNFWPEGMSKWLMDLTRTINKKWLREEISWDISDEARDNLTDSAREKMLKASLAGKTIYKDLSLGLVEVSYDKMTDIWEAQLQQEPDSTFLDIQNAFKYSEVMGTLRADPEKVYKSNSSKESDPNTPKTTRELAKEDYKGDYDHDRIAVFICQDKKAGELDEKLEVATQNGLRLSLRSNEGTTHAEILASLFGGGGHGGASGGRIDLPGIEIDSPLAVKIDGKIERNYAAILQALQDNYDITNKKDGGTKKRHQTEVVIDQNGVPCRELIKNIVTNIKRPDVIVAADLMGTVNPDISSDPRQKKRKKRDDKNRFRLIENLRKEFSNQKAS